MTLADIAILIPAAGSSRRMRGEDKLTRLVAGQPLLRRQAGAALATKAPVIVTLPPVAHPHHAGRLSALAGLPATRLTVADADEGMAASIRAGVGALPAGVGGMMILLPDLPEIESGDLLTLLAAFRADPAGPVLRATSQDGTPGHPVLLPARLFAALARLTGDQGARAVLAAESPRLIALPGQRAVTDLDTPEDWARWRSATGL